MLKRVLSWINDILRITAIRRMLSIVDIRRVELVGLVLFAAAYAVLEGLGLSLLLPILQYAESGQTAINQGGGFIWGLLSAFMQWASLPITLPVLLLLAFVPILLRQAVYYVNTWYSAVVANRIAVRLRMQALDSMLDADPDFFSRHSVGHLVGIIITQTFAAGTALLQVMRQLSYVLLLALYVLILLAISVPLTLSVVFFAGLVSMTVRANVVRIRDFGVEAARISQEMTGKIVERLSLIRLIKLRDQEEVESKRVLGFSHTMADLAVKQARLGANIEITADPLLMLSVFITLFIGIEILGMTLAQLGLLLFVLTRLNAKVKEFNQGRQLISANMAGILLLREMTEDARASNTIRPGAVRFSALERGIELKGVTFEYPSDSGDPKAVLKGVTVSIPAGSFTALVGRSGAGKSTLVELLPRLRDISSGSIEFDGTDVREFDVGSLRKGIGYLTQSALLFNESVRENLVYGLDFEPSDEQIRDALEKAHAAFVYDLPKGLETRLGDRGVRFSGGERQRIGLARVLLQGTSVLILDEPTSALDSESETYIQDTLKRLHGEITVIVIAHRLATVIQADQLLVMDEGRVMERGKHDELIAADGIYRRLFESQLLK